MSVFTQMLFAQGVHVTLRANADPFPAFESYASVWGDGHFAYVGSERRNGVLIFDVANPDAPVLVGSYAPTNSLDMEDVKVANGIGFFADNMGSGLHIVDVSDPANPTLLSQITSANGGFDNTHKIAVWNNFVFIPQNLTSPAIIKVFDVSNPSSPVLKTTFTSTDSKWVNDVTIQTTTSGSVRLYTAGWGGTGDIWDITNIASQAPVLLGSFSAGLDGSSTSATDDGNFLAYSRKTIDGTSEVRIWDISNPASATVASTITMSAFGIDAVAPHDPKIMGNLLYVSWFQAGTLIFDITDPTKPILVGAYDTWPAVPSPGQLEGNWGVYPYLGQDRVLISDRNTGLYIVDATGVSSKPDLYNLHVTPTTVLAGSSATGTIYLVGTAGAGGTVVATTSDNPAAIPPPNATIPATGTTASFTISTTAVNSTTTANISASLNGASNSAALNITPSPDFAITLGPSSLTLFPNQVGTFSGVVTAFAGYSHSVTLSCTAPAPPTCSFSPASLTPTSSGAPFTLTVSSASTTNYAFNVQGIGTDSLQRQAPATVNVSDFTLSAAIPSALTVTPGSVSQFSIQVAAAGMFSALVDLTCNAPASGITCSFSPSGAVMLSPGAAVTVNVSVTVPASAPAGSYTLMVSANSSGAPAPKTQAVGLAVIDFGVSASSTAQTVQAGQTAAYTLSVSPVGGSFGNAITFSCTGAPELSACSVTPSSVTPGASAATVNVSVTTTAATTAQRSAQGAMLYALSLPLGALLLGGVRKRMTKSLAILIAVTMLIGCGGGSSSTPGGPTARSGTPTGTYTLVVNADSGTLHHPTTLTLTVQ
ncbi:MAG TPA: NEW3 domain-containing protein [Terriglobales bacterium]|nr:NEW3 domain-containing protein [Terriglobales bacterium]